MVQFDWSKEEFVPLVHAKNEGDINSGEAQPEGKILGQLFLYLNVLSHFIEKNKKTEGVLQPRKTTLYVTETSWKKCVWIMLIAECRPRGVSQGKKFHRCRMDCLLQFLHCDTLD